MTLGRSFLRCIGGLENVGASVFKTKSAADEALKAVKHRLEKDLVRDGQKVGDELARSLLERARVVGVGTATAATAGFRVVMETEGGAAAVTLKKIVRDVRRGHVTEVLDGLKVPSDSAFRRPGFVEHMRRALTNTYPDAAVDDLARRLRSVREVPPALFESTAAYESVDDLVRLVEAHGEVAKRLVRAVDTALKNGRPVVAKGLFFGAVLTTGGVYAVCAALFESAKRAAGCWRVYRDRDTGELVSCRVRYASCEIEREGGGGGSLPYDKYCDRYPTVVTETSCADEWTGDGPSPCVRCDPTAAEGTVQHLRVEDYVDPRDMYTCRPKPSLGEMLGQLVVDSPHVLSEAAGDVVDGAENVFGTVWRTLKRAALWCAVFGLLIFAAVIFFTRGVWNGSPENVGYTRLLGNRDEDDDDDDDDRRVESDDEITDRGGRSDVEGRRTHEYHRRQDTSI